MSSVAVCLVGETTKIILSGCSIISLAITKDRAIGVNPSIVDGKDESSGLHQVDVEGRSREIVI
jgi:hypothetical protein